MKAPIIGAKEIVYEDRFQRIYKVAADFGNFKKEYFVRDSGRRAGVLVVRDNFVLIVRQYRLMIEGISWEIPGGRVDEGETPEAAARRECLEETGIWCEKLRPLLSYHMGLDALHNPTDLFYTNDCRENRATKVNPQEIQGHEWVSLANCVEMVFDRRIVDSFSILAVLSYKTMLGKP